MTLQARLDRLPLHCDVSVYMVLRTCEGPDGSYDFLDQDTLHATYEGALRLATLADAAQPMLGEQTPMTCVVALHVIDLAVASPDA